MSQKEASVLLLIPAYNEQDRIGPTLRDYADFFRKNYQGKFEILVVLNGCTDNTLAVVQKAGEEFPEIHSLVFPAPIGKGGALIEGFRLTPQAELVGYVDADGATPPSAFLDLIKHAGEADCVIGSRWVPGAVLHQMQTGRRQFASRVFHAIVQILFRLNIKDTQCGAKLIRREAMEKVHSELVLADMSFDINLLFILDRNHFKILEVPTEWTDKVGSKVALGRTSMTMLLSVLRLRTIYSPAEPLRALLRPIELWLYRKLHAPPPNPDPKLKSSGGDGGPSNR